MRKTFTVLMLLACVFCGSYAISACTCLNIEAPEAFERSRGVFIGKVSEKGGFYPFVVFKVEKSWKSIDSDEITLNLSYGTCGGIDFQEGSRYLVYSYENEGDWYVGGACSRTNQISAADEDLNFLESKETLPLKKEFFTRYTRIGLITSLVVLIFLGIGCILMRFRKSR